MSEIKGLVSHAQAERVSKALRWLNSASNELKPGDVIAAHALLVRGTLKALKCKGSLYADAYREMLRNELERW